MAAITPITVEVEVKIRRPQALANYLREYGFTPGEARALRSLAAQQELSELDALRRAVRICQLVDDAADGRCSFCALAELGASAPL